MFLIVYSTGASALTLGETRRSAEVYFDPIPCREIGKAPGLKIANSYIRSLLSHIVDSNPATFEGAEPVCAHIDEVAEDPDSLYGQALPEERRIQISPAIVIAARTDAELAALLGHELAHVSLQHHEATLGDSQSPWWKMHQQLIEVRRKSWAINKEDDALSSELNRQRRARSPKPGLLETLEEKSRKLFSLRIELMDARDEIETRIQEMQGKSYPSDYVARWVEQEADEAGFEIYLRAGFPAEPFTWRMEEGALENELHIRGAAARELSAEWILEQCKQGREKPSYTRPNLEDYPSDCWRIWNIREGLSDYRTELEADGSSVPAFKPSLEDAKQELTKSL